MKHEIPTEGAGSRRASSRSRRTLAAAAAAFAVALGLLTSGAMSSVPGDEAPSLEETRLTMNKWIETQQIISKERNDWQQGKEILVGRLELVRKEVTSLEEKIQEAEQGVAAADKKRDELKAEDRALEVIGEQLTQAVARLEDDVRRLYETMPQPVRERIDPLYQRIPTAPGADVEGAPKSSRVSVAERFQNVLGILNELNKANNEITVNYEVHTLANGKPSEVRAVYAGLAQAWYVSSSGEAGIGRPSAEGWQWEPSKAIAGDVLKTLEILQGKHSPEFVGLPVRVQ